MRLQGEDGETEGAANNWPEEFGLMEKSREPRMALEEGIPSGLSLWVEERAERRPWLQRLGGRERAELLRRRRDEEADGCRPVSDAVWGLEVGMSQGQNFRLGALL